MKKAQWWLPHHHPLPTERLIIADIRSWPLIVRVCGGPATRSTENAYGGGCKVDTTTRGQAMSHVRRFDHVGLTVADLDVVTAFFVALGLEVEGRTFVEGEFLDTVCGIPDSAPRSPC